MVMMCCVFLLDKIIDSDRTKCTIQFLYKIFKCYVAPEGPPALSIEEDYVAFRDSFANLEIKILRAVNYEIMAFPIPAEFLTLDSNWFSHFDCAQSHGYFRPLDIQRGKDFSFLCDSFVHSYQSTFYTCSEIAAAAIFCCTNSENKVVTKVPMPNCALTVTPNMRALWGTVPWSRGIEIAHAMLDVADVVLKISCGLQRIYEWKYMKQLKK